MELVIVRHGRPRRIEAADGPADPPLTDVGHRQSEALAGWLTAERLDAIYVSPMQRARQTSRPLEERLGIQATVIDGVREFDDHAADYIPMEELKADKEAWRAWLAENVELAREAFHAEVLATLNELVAAHRGDRIAVICHGGVINSWAADVLGIGPSLFFAPDYTSINRFLCASSGERSVVSLNDIGHLRPHPELVLGG